VDDEWLEEEELEILDRAKLLGMRICTHRALGFARHPEAGTVVKDTFTLLQSILSEFENGKLLGQVNEKTMEGWVKFRTSASVPSHTIQGSCSCAPQVASCVMHPQAGQCQGV
jgi:hypothetical protein